MNRALLTVLEKKFPDIEKKKLYAYIMCGEVLVNGSRIKNPKESIPANSHIEIRTKKYVSRGGVKLEAALGEFKFSVQNKVLLDAGSSTGGFTDCLLQHGASFVHAVDSGKNQLNYSLRRDSRVAVLEETRIQDVSCLEPKPYAAVADISFRSLSGIASAILKLTESRTGIFLIKPQFEIEETIDGFRGVVPQNLLESVLYSISHKLSQEQVVLDNIIESPIKGTGGNREFLGLFHLAEGIGSREDFTALISKLAF